MFARRSGTVRTFFPDKLGRADVGTTAIVLQSRISPVGRLMDELLAGSQKLNQLSHGGSERSRPFHILSPLSTT